MNRFLHHNLSAELDPEAKGGVIAIGNFDGVHIGHQYVLQAAMDQAKELGKPCYALSFEPHPRTLFQPQSPVFRLTPEVMKSRILQAYGLDGLLVLPFTQELANTPADEFVEEFLLGKSGVSHVVSGFNFHFGKGRKGSPKFLRNAGKELGFGVTIVDAVSDGTTTPISSSTIREHLENSEIDHASRLLSYRWNIKGDVIKGAQLGRTLNYPTANLALPANSQLAHGIYAVRVRREDGNLYNGVASFGRRPTFDNGEALFETFIFDFSEDIYGENIEVSLFAYLRGEEKFESVDELVSQMDDDSRNARNVLANCKPLSELDQRLNFYGLNEINGKV